MAQTERLHYLITYLINEQLQYSDIQIPDRTTNEKRLLRSLMNIRPPIKADDEFLKIQ